MILALLSPHGELCTATQYLIAVEGTKLSNVYDVYERLIDANDETNGDSLYGAVFEIPDMSPLPTDWGAYLKAYELIHTDFEIVWF